MLRASRYLPLFVSLIGCRVVNLDPSDTGAGSGAPMAVGSFRLGPPLDRMTGPSGEIALGSEPGAAGDSADAGSSAEAADPAGAGGSASSSKPGNGGASSSPVSAGASSSVAPCGALLTGIVRDFKGANELGGHPDFEAFFGADPSLGIVLPILGSDRKPVYSADGPFIDGSVNGDQANGQQTTDKEHFDQWYRTVPGVNLAYLVYITSGTSNGLRTFQSDAFFPLDGKGWGNTPNLGHNFSFTTEVHTRFEFRSGQVFSFTGDDDLWVFVNHKLLIDLGGLHSASTKSVSLDTESARFGLEIGHVYDLDLFHAERHSAASDFQMDTNLEFTECGLIVPDAAE